VADARHEILDAGLRVALAEISFGKVEGPFWHPRQPRIVSVGGKRVEVTLERGEYLIAGLKYEPRNAPMESVEEVRQVMDLRSLSDSSLDAFTVYSQQLEPAPSEAPQAVRESLAWLAGVAGQGGVNALPAAALPNSNEAVSHAGSVGRLRACVEGDAPYRTIVVRITGSARQPWQILAWF